jgi:pimeloyl-ACP methyl ester carboxylesterase
VNRARASAFVSLLAAVLLLDGCKFYGLKKDVARFNALGLIGGHVSRAQDDDAPIIVLLTTSAAPTKVLDSFVLERPGAYFFVVPAGTYQIAAFVDRKRDFTYAPDQDPAVFYGAPTVVEVAAGQKVAGLDLHIPPAPGVRLDFPIVALEQFGKRGTRAIPPVEIGDIVSLDDPRFAPENGTLGMWQPVEFLFDVGAGFYFLQEYDPRKVPVLFVHGVGGTPRDWTYLIEHLDRTKFQPWVLFYPSGGDLDLMARGSARWLGTLAARYELRHVIIVAHSMGGLVSRATINELTNNGSGGLLALFVSISSPWNGYGAAASGAEHSPVVMPMWTDMAPGSAFLKGLFATPLPPQCPYDLFFSYAGHSLLMGQANDGVVALSSELARPAQQAAQKVYGFDATHMTILDSAEVSQTLNSLLSNAVP